MLNLFPNLFTYGIFIPTLLRLAAALTLAYLAYMQYRRRNEIKHLPLPLLGKQSWWHMGPMLLNIVLAGMLFVGYYTQAAALVTLAVHLIFGLWSNRRYPEVAILPNSTVLLLLVICVSLLFLGAGAFAFDIPQL